MENSLPSPIVPKKIIFTFASGHIFDPFLHSVMNVAIPIFKGADTEIVSELKTQTYIIKANTRIMLVDLNNDNIIHDDMATILQELEVNIPNGMRIKQGNNDFITGLCDRKHELSFFVLPIEIKLKIGASKQITSLNYYFKIICGTVLTQKSGSLLRLGKMEITTKNIEDVTLVGSGVPNNEMDEIVNALSFGNCHGLSLRDLMPNETFRRFNPNF